MAWKTPKTDWHGSTNSEGVYTGDRFNASDFNRIKNNLEFLRELAITMYDDFVINNLGNDRTPKDYFYADEINRLFGTNISVELASTWADNKEINDLELENMDNDTTEEVNTDEQPDTASDNSAE